MSVARAPIVHLNASPTLGGAEVYTGFLARALQQAGWENEIVVAKDAAFWRGISRGDARLAHHDFRMNEDIRALPADSLICIHSPVPKGLVDRLASRHRVLGLAHQAIYSSSVPYYYRAAHKLLPVSQYVAATLRIAGFSPVQSQPLLGVAELKRSGQTADILQGPLVEWDRRKLRDRVFAACEPLSRLATAQNVYVKRPGLTLGIVSRLAPLKQFPELFRAIMPVLLKQQDLNIEIFGSAIGYREMRELKAVLLPLGGRVRFWGFQSDVASVYVGLDYLLTGLPEREALGLNVIESQQCGVPVLAPDAPPFTETVIDGVTGYLFADPRQDEGIGFAAALERARKFRPDPRLASAHLAKFSFPAFVARADEIFAEEALAAEINRVNSAAAHA